MCRQQGGKLPRLVRCQLLTYGNAIGHTILARTHDGGTVMVIGHPHAATVALLHETEPGTFELGPEGSPFPMKVVLSMPEPGQLRHAWWYGAPGDQAVERDVALVTRVR